MVQFLASAVLGSLLVLALPHQAHAATIKVGNGTPASCTEAALRSALLDAQARGGATIRFKCGRTRTTIAVTGGLLIPDDTTIDGEGMITLQGHDDVDVIGVAVDVRAALSGLTITNIGGGGAVVNAGTLTIVDSTLDGGFGICGGLVSNGGTLTVRHSKLRNGDAFLQGGALCNFGTATIHISTFSDNAGGGGANGGGAIWNIGEMNVTFSAFVHNTGFNDRGGAVYNGGVLTVRNSIFFQNDGGAGGAIFNDALGFFTDPETAGTLTVRNTVILENVANGVFSIQQGHGGGIVNQGGTATIENSVIAENAAVAPGGGVYTCCGGTTTLKKTVVTGNTPDNVVVDP